nr:hypothetical protein Q903MT_gene6107 [Picea sitchensis]
MPRQFNNTYNLFVLVFQFSLLSIVTICRACNHLACLFFLSFATEIFGYTSVPKGTGGVGPFLDRQIRLTHQPSCFESGCLELKLS